MTDFEISYNYIKKNSKIYNVIDPVMKDGRRFINYYFKQTTFGTFWVIEHHSFDNVSGVFICKDNLFTGWGYGDNFVPERYQDFVSFIKKNNSKNTIKVICH